MNDKTKEAVQLAPKKPIGQLKNYACAMTANALAITIAYTSAYLLGLNLWLTASVVLGVLYYVGYRRFRKLETGFNGIPEFLRNRVRWFTFPEGWVWVPSLMSVVSVDMRERTADIKEAIVISKNNVRMQIDTRLMWQIIDPYQTLDIGEDVVKDGLRDLVVNTLREEARKHTDKDLMTKEINLGAKINKAADANSDRWGIKTVQVLVPKVVPAADNVIEAWERESIEERQAKSEAIENEHFIERVERMSDGGNKMPYEIAAAFFQTERGKQSPVRKLIIEGDKGNPIVKAGAAVNDGLINQPTKESE